MIFFIDIGPFHNSNIVLEIGLSLKLKFYWSASQFLILLLVVRRSPQLAKQEKQQQRKEKTRSKGPSEAGREKSSQRHRPDHNASSGAEGDVSSEREA